jgi:hypothetical protein
MTAPNLHVSSDQEAMKGVEPASGNNLPETPKFNDIIIAIHGIGKQHRSETVRSVANRLAFSKSLLGDTKPYLVAPQPLGYFHAPVRKITSVCPLDDLESLKNTDLATIGFAEVFWADIPQKVVREGRTLDETKAWARTVVARANSLYQQAKAEKRCGIIEPDFNLAAEVLDEIIDTVQVLENLSSIAGKAGIFHFNLRDLLVEYIGDVQLVTEFIGYRIEILRRFNTALTYIFENYCKDDPKVRLHIVAHSEGTVISFLAMLYAMSGKTLRFDDTPPHRPGPKNIEIPPWLARIKGFMTIGSPIDKHLLLWHRLWTDLEPKTANKLFETEKIHWRNYYDYGDPIGFKLDTARLWLQKKECTAFEFRDGDNRHDDIGFARYLLPGKAHDEYWNDPEVFEHFINAVVRPGKGSAAPPKSKPVVRWLSPSLPYLLSFLLLFLGVFIIYKSAHAFIHPSFNPLQKFVRFSQLGITPPPEPSPWDALWASVGIAFLIAGGTLLTRIPRLAVSLSSSCQRTRELVKRLNKHRWATRLLWHMAGLGAFLAGSFLYYMVVPREIRADIGHPFSHPTLAIILIAAFGGLSGFLSASTSHTAHDHRLRWFRRGMRPLIFSGALALLAMIVAQLVPQPINTSSLSQPGGNPLNAEQIKIVQESGLTSNELSQVAVARGTNWIDTLKKVAPVLAAHPPAWPVLLSSAAFLYLWWLAALIFDLAFVWHRYIRHSVTNERLLEWNPYKFDLSDKTKEAAANKRASAPV